MSRPRCTRCQRPLAHCLCALIPSLPSRTRVVLLQHASETPHALNTARLAALGLRNAELLSGEVFDELPALLATPGYRPALLFPGEQAEIVQPYAEHKAPQPGALSTIEAVVQALDVLEAPVRFDALLRPFEALIEGQIQAMGAETFERNHGQGGA